MSLIRFDEIFKEEFLENMYSEFFKYLNNRIIGDRFKKVLQDDIFVGLDRENVLKIMRNLEVDIDSIDFPLFLESNCYQVGFPLYFNKGHNFTDKEKLALAAFRLFEDCVKDSGYPYNEPEGQIDEHLSHGMLGTAFVETCFKWGMETLVQRYNMELKAKE